MPKFKPGDVCIVMKNKLYHSPILEGFIVPDEITLVQYEGAFYPWNIHKDWWKTDFVFNGEPLYLSECVLRPKKPPEEISSWPAIESITKWSPEVIEA